MTWSVNKWKGNWRMRVTVITYVFRLILFITIQCLEGSSQRLLPVHGKRIFFCFVWFFCGGWNRDFGEEKENEQQKLSFRIEKTCQRIWSFRNFPNSQNTKKKFKIKKVFFLLLIKPHLGLVKTLFSCG